jgi:hypothetical protein
MKFMTVLFLVPSLYLYFCGPYGCILLFTNFVPAAVILLSSLLQIVQVSLPSVSTDFSNVLYTLLVCFCIKLCLKTWFITHSAQLKFVIFSAVSFSFL